jgi:cyanophycinase-like exopeptidase
MFLYGYYFCFTLLGFFVGGGDQTRLIQSYYSGPNNSTTIASSALIAIRNTLYATGGVIAGTSAGCDIQTSNVMITGGESYEGLINGADIYWQPLEDENPTVLTGICILISISIS